MRATPSTAAGETPWKSSEAVRNPPPKGSGKGELEAVVAALDTGTGDKENGDGSQ